jgi:ankyrin repeat protein
VTQDAVSDALGWTPLHHACFFGGPLESLEHAAALTVDKLSALHLAVLARNLPLVLRLLESEEVRAAEAHQRFATTLAAELGELEILSALHARQLHSYDDNHNVRLLRGLGCELAVVAPGEHMQFEPIEAEVLALTNDVVLPPLARTLVRDATVETDAAGQLQKLSSERYVITRSAAPPKRIAAGFLPDPVRPVTPIVQRHLRGETISDSDLLYATEGLCALGCTETVKLLVGERVAFWTSPEPGANALIRAGSQRAVVDGLFELMPDSAASTLVGTAHEALRLGRAFVADGLLRRGLSVDAACGGDSTLLMAAVRSRKRDVVKALLAWRPDVNRVLPLAQQQTALLLAINLSEPELVDALLSAGADPNLAGDVHNIYTHPLAALARSDVYRSSFRAQIFSSLVRAGANPNWQALDGNTPLHVERYIDIQQWLIAAGASLDMRNAAGLTPVMSVVFHSFPVAKALLQHKRGLEHVDAEGNTLVHLACFSAWPSREIFEWLRAAGLDLKAKNALGETPEQRASRPYGAYRASTEQAVAFLRALTS